MEKAQWTLFGLIGPAVIDRAEAAFWLDGIVGGQIGMALQKQFLYLVGRPTAIGRPGFGYHRQVGAVPQAEELFRYQ